MPQHPFARLSEVELFEALHTHIRLASEAATIIGRHRPDQAWPTVAGALNAVGQTVHKLSEAGDGWVKGAKPKIILPRGN
jgi:hypothetical protein